MKFADGVPANEGRITVQVNGQSDGHVNVKTIASETNKTMKTENSVYRNLGISEKDPVHVKQAVNKLLEKGTPLTKETVTQLKDFMINGKGTIQSKLETVEALANKRLEPTTPQLRAVHEALHGKPLNEVLANIAKEIDPDFEVAKAIHAEKAAVSQTRSATTQLHPGNIETLLQKNIEQVKNNPDLKQVVAQIKKELVESPNLDPKLSQQIEKVANDAEKLHNIGRERLHAVLKSVESQLGKGSQLSTEIQSQSDSQKIIQKVQEFLSNDKTISSQFKNELLRLANQAHQLDQVGRERLMTMLQQAGATLNINDGQQIQKSEVQQADMMQKAIKLVQQEPNFTKVIEGIRNEMNKISGLDPQTIQKLENVLSQATQLKDQGRELAARQLLAKELTEIEQKLAKNEPQINPTAVQDEMNEQLQALNLSTKDILVTKISQKLAQATADFQNLKRDITRNLNQVEHSLNTIQNNGAPQAKQALEATIRKLDHAILKSDMMLFTDMKTEKQLLQASSQLAEAKKLLAKGQHVEAGKIVHEMKNLIEQIVYKPSQQKIVHYVKGESLALNQSTPEQQLLTKMAQANPEPSARQMFEMVRTLGLNHESETAQSLVFQKNLQADQSHEQNLKSILMKLAQGDSQGEQKGLAQQADQALTQLTGQQLLSKSDGNGSLQSMFLNLPLLLGGKPENLKVYINSKNEGDQIQWENCSLYFLLDTKKLGDVGIHLNSTDRNLSITIKNDLPLFKEKMAPLAAVTKEKLQEVGYNVTNISFAPLKESPSEVKKVQTQKPVLTGKGLNFTI